MAPAQSTLSSSTTSPSTTTTGNVSATAQPNAPFQAWTAVICIIAAIFIISTICSAIFLRDRVIKNGQNRRSAEAPSARGPAPATSSSQDVEMPYESWWGRWRSAFIQSSTHQNTSHATSQPSNLTISPSACTLGTPRTGTPKTTSRPSSETICMRVRAFFVNMCSVQKSSQRQLPYNTWSADSMGSESTSSSDEWTLVGAEGDIALPKPAHISVSTRGEAVTPKFMRESRLEGAVHTVSKAK